MLFRSRPQVPDWAPPSRWSAELARPRWLAGWSPRELRAPGAGRVGGPASRGGADASKAPGARSAARRLRGGAVTATAAWVRSCPRDPRRPLGARTWGEGGWSPPRLSRPGGRGASRPGFGQRLGPKRPGWPPASPRRAPAQSAGLRASPCGAVRFSAILRAFHPAAVPKGSPAVTNCQIRSPS